MSTAIIIHGTAGYPEENWFPWMKTELEKKGFTVFVPQFPTPEDQTPNAWFAVFKQYEPLLDKNSILIGHSLGGSFLLWVLEQTKIQVKAAVFVAAALGVQPLKNFATDKPFVDKEFNWKKIRKHAQHFLVFHSEDDSLVGIGNGQKLADNLGIQLINVPHAGHFNAASGYTSFPLLMEKLSQLIST